MLIATIRRNHLINNALLIIQNRGYKAFFSALYYRLLILLNNLVPIKRFIQRKIYNYKMYLDVKDAGISRSLLLHAERELDHKFMLEQVVRPGMTIFDIGANIGYYVLMEKKLLGETGNIIAIEPSPSNIKLLEKNLSLNNVKGVQVYNMAISDIEETKVFYLAKQSNLNTFHATGSGLAHLSGEVISVKTATVPGLAAEVGLTPDLIRMDVEGHEVEVIRGMLPAIERGEMRPSIIFETHLSRYTKDHDFVVVLRQLFNLGYKTKLISSSSERGTKIINKLGYQAFHSESSDDVIRYIYNDIDNDNAISLICQTGGVRTVYLEKIIE